MGIDFELWGWNTYYMLASRIEWNFVEILLAFIYIFGDKNLFWLALFRLDYWILDIPQKKLVRFYRKLTVS